MRANTLWLLWALSIVGATGNGQESARPYAEAGCGWGSQVMGKESQVIAATTNGTSANQTFAISSGTSNCVQSYNKEVVEGFIDVNQPRLASELSQGEGEMLSTLEFLMGCPEGALGKLKPIRSPSPAEFRHVLLGTIQKDFEKQCTYF